MTMITYLAHMEVYSIYCPHNRSSTRVGNWRARSYPENNALVITLRTRHIFTWIHRNMNHLMVKNNPPYTSTEKREFFALL